MGNDSKKTVKTVFIIDGSSVIYRAFHAIPPTLTNSKGLPTNAIYGFLQSLRKILTDFKPGYIGIAFDVKGPSFRHELFTGYKAERKPMPDLLSIQIPYIKRVVEAFNIPVLEKQSFEADDIIATVVKKLEGMGARIALITGDKDMYQLVDENTYILDYLTGKEFGPAEVVEKFGVGPGQIRDLLGLAGDSSDSIPGVPGIGVKTAAKLINQFGSLEKILEASESISGEKVRNNLKTYKDQAILSRDLATLHPEVPFECGLDTLEYFGPDFKRLESLLSELEFKKILKEMIPETPGPQDEAGDFRAIMDGASLSEALKEIKSRASLILFMTDDGMAGSLTGLSIAQDQTSAFYVPVERGESAGVPEAVVLNELGSFLADETIRKDTDNSKALYIYFGRNGVDLNGVGVDTAIASYLINPSKPDHTIDGLSHEYLGLISKDESIVDLDLSEATRYACRKACNIIRISEILERQLEEEGLRDLYSGMELPLSKILAGMEIAGIKVDKERLGQLSKEMEVELGSYEERIYRAAGTEFNINSPKQLSELLFEKLGLKPVKKTKTGYSTDEEVLTQLALKHDVPALIISYRQLAKLKGTYVDALLQIINPVTGRVHTSFNQTVTATGRLSSSKPNLQNIPIRSEAAGRIREAFIAEKGFRFLSADYSQIELRIVAHMSSDPVLIDAFTKGEDIHTRTASEIFGIMPLLVTSEMRRRAKAINFGIIYGMGPYGLSTELGISMKEALEYINSYFEHYSAVKQFIDKTVFEASSRGYTMTLFGRRRFIPELKSPVESTQRLGQRLAINTPIQGSAADMIKAAMIKISGILKEGGYRTRMILQIHDELLFEVCEEEMSAVTGLVKKEMEGVVSLSVPIDVNIKSGLNWNSVEYA
ncbi:MAG: DNA polymerase I [Deltaproteobacteria bacterium]|nr:DNA polymerase I [Deltaproteobacteria bacterium]